MKVITGKYKNRILRVPAGRERLRMTTGLVKKVVIDIFQFKLKDVLVLELFAGSGNVGIELLSNSAGRVVFIEIEDEYCDIIQKNLENLGLDKDEKSLVINNNVEMGLKVLDKKFCFDYIYLDPPYKDNLVSETLLNISEADVYDKNTIIIAEHHFKEKVEEEIGKFRRTDSRKYGMTVLDFFQLG